MIPSMTPRTPAPGPRWVALVTALASAVACAGCASNQGQPASAVAQDTASIQSYLTAGPWRLVDYRPDVTLEPMLQAMLAAQVRTMVLRFDGRSLSAQSPTLQVTRPYTIENPAGLTFDIVSPDVQFGGAPASGGGGGATVQSHCEMGIGGRVLTFRARTDPWTGIGTLQREGP
jgi:hypothetical protein